MAARKLCSVSIDLDPLRCYYEIHGLGEAPAELADVVNGRCLPRFLELFERRGIKATLFVVGADLETDGEGPGNLAAAARAGHELANHSYSHPYDMARLPRGEVDREIGLAHALIGDVAGRPVRGFRAPGYDLSADMLDELARLGYAYDSSIFPAPGYYAAKAAVMGALAVLGRPSGAVMTDPRALLAPTEPYRPSIDKPWRRGQSSVIELPIAVTPRLRLPAIGTSLLLAPSWARARLLESMRSRSFFNLELHGIDLIDADADAVPAELVAREPALRRSGQDKRRALEATLDRLAADYTFVPLIDVAAWAHREAV